MKTNTAPKTASLPNLTREVIATWEQELDHFVVDIQARLEKLAVRLSASSAVSKPQVVEVESPANLLDPVAQAPLIDGQFDPMGSSDHNSTDDRLQAIKQRLTARLQGETS